MFNILIPHLPSVHVGLAGVRSLHRFPYTRESQWHDEQCWIYCRVHTIFPFQEEIFHLEPGKVESGKGKCSYDPKLSSISALISEYHLLTAVWGQRHRSSSLRSNGSVKWFGFLVHSCFFIWPSRCAKCLQTLLICVSSAIKEVKKVGPSFLSILSFPHSGLLILISLIIYPNYNFLVRGNVDTVICAY